MEAARARTQRLVHVLVEVGRRQHQHARMGLRPGEDAPGRLEAVDVRHAHVHEHDVRPDTTGRAGAVAFATGAGLVGALLIYGGWYTGREGRRRTVSRSTTA
jgi:hypothetical protein